MVLWPPRQPRQSPRRGLSSLSAECTLRVQRIQTCSFYSRNYTYGLGYIPSIWVLGPLTTGRFNVNILQPPKEKQRSISINHHVSMSHHVGAYCMPGLVSEKQHCSMHDEIYRVHRHQRMEPPLKKARPHVASYGVHIDPTAMIWELLCGPVTSYHMQLHGGFGEVKLEGLRLAVFFLRRLLGICADILGEGLGS